MSNGQGLSGSLGEWQPGAAAGPQCHTSSHSLLSRPASPPRTCDPKPEPFVGLSSAQGTPTLPCPASSAPTPSPQPSLVCEGQPSTAPPEPSQPTQQPQGLTQPRLVVGAGKGTQSRPQALPCWTPGHTPQNRPTPTWTSPSSQMLQGCQGPSGFSFWRQRCSGEAGTAQGPRAAGQQRPPPREGCDTRWRLGGAGGQVSGAGCCWTVRLLSSSLDPQPLGRHCWIQLALQPCSR